jgi:hypothetical protein
MKPYPFLYEHYLFSKVLGAKDRPWTKDENIFIRGRFFFQILWPPQDAQYINFMFILSITDYGRPEKK